MNNIKHILAQVLIILILFSCEKDENNIIGLNGIVQKGPFQTGTNITIYELDNSLNQTGKSFNTTVYNDFGEFEIQNIELSSNYIEVVADGFYYNEKQGDVSDNKLVLKTISDISISETVNINILTYLETERLKYLVQTENYDFYNAKQQAKNEILSIFSFDTNSISDFESLDISSSGDLNNMLTAISLLLLGNNTASELSKNLTEISFDLKTDGIINSEEIETKLATSARLLDIGQMIKNLTILYNDTIFYGLTSYVDYFLTNTDFNSLIKVDFPTETETGKNILKFPENSKLKEGNSYSLGINFDENQSKFNFWISVLCPENTCSITVNNNNMEGWLLDLSYKSYNPESHTSLHGFLLESSDPAKTSNNPLSFNLIGNGEVMVTLCYQANYLPNGGLFYVRRYFKL
jgi:hypothetical protein